MLKRREAIAAVVSLIVAFLLTLGLARLASADDGEVWVTSGMWSHHMNEDAHHYNQDNYGMGLQYERGHYSLVAGRYFNSLYHESTYVGMMDEPWRVWKARVGFAAVLVSGYTRTPRYEPAIAPAASLEFGHVGVNIIWVPSIVVAVQVKLRVW